MADAENSTPPVGEEIHLPGPTVVPLVLAVGVATLLVGLTTSIILLVVGLLITLGALIRWIRDARRDFSELPPEHR
jgi:hypothetical protein